MQTPAGYVLKSGTAYPVDWFHIIFNPSFPFRFAHMMTAAFLTTSVVVLAVGARYLQAKQFEAEGRTMMRMGVGMVALLGPLQLLLGDMHGLNTLRYQPAKIAAMEGHWESETPAGLLLFAWPRPQEERNLYEIEVPKLGSLILTHSWNGRVPALKDFPANERPPVANVFFAFRLMVGIGLLLITIGLTGAILWKRGLLFTTRWYLKPVGYAWPLGFIAIIAGWITTEQGRQPWVAYKILRTADAVSPVAPGAIATSLIAFVIVYAAVFSTGIYYMRKLINKGPSAEPVIQRVLP
jgi:cytochrome d ubiquinol oxidase subunit I